MDGESGDDAQVTLDNLMTSQSLRDTWWRYHLISEVMNQNISDTIDKNMAARIANIISDDTVVFAGNRFTSNRFFKPAAGFAIAASVAAMAILGIQHTNRQPEQANTLQVAADRTPDYTTNVSRYTFPAAANAVSTRVDQVQAGNIERNNPQLNSYLVNYNEYRTSQNGVQGIIPYVRIIANDEDQ